MLAGEVLVRLATGTAPVSWAGVGPLDGQVGYKNAQAAVVAIGIPLAVRLVGTRRPPRAGRGRWRLGPPARRAAPRPVAGRADRASGRAAPSDLVDAQQARPRLRGRARRRDAAPRRRADARQDGHARGRQPGRPRRDLPRGLVSRPRSPSRASPSGDTAPGGRAGRRAWSAAAAALVAVAGLALAATRSDLAHAVESDPPGRAGSGASSASASGTHLASLSLNGRKEAWRVAGGLIADHPLIGDGQSAFARRWAAASHTGPTLYILQPHSLELELLSELGVVGLGIFVLLGGAPRPGARPFARTVRGRQPGSPF